mgnify:FL=1|tara:strand:- start:5071 stop:5922 length:852 start_codon:yes stop_codon:yes gene_type:complete
MGIYTNRELLSEAISKNFKGKKIGFVPTMGALHKGHLSLVKRALQDNDGVVVSIFVNPTQFDNATDLDKYPRTLENDVSLLKSIKGKVLVFAPNASDLYNGKVVSKKYNFGKLENEMEGKHRKGHFDGVGTVVNLLLRAVDPDKAYFGEKDFQQLQIVKKLLEIEGLSVKIIGCPIVRESNGLAMSSRNKRLTKEQFDEAAFIYKTLSEVKNKFNTHSITQLTRHVHKVFSENKMLTLEYFEITNEKNLKTAIRKRDGNTYRAFIAVFAGDVRLIDNLSLGKW